MLAEHYGHVRKLQEVAAPPAPVAETAEARRSRAIEMLAAMTRSAGEPMPNARHRAGLLVGALAMIFESRR
jgi:hypothetical protein